MTNHPVQGNKVLVWLAMGLFLLFATILPFTDLQAAGVVGTGTPGSCTQAALTTALNGGGTITFNCGPAPATILVTSQMTINQNTFIDGGNLITITGGLTTRFFDVPSIPGVTLLLSNIILESAYSAGSGGGNGGAIRSSGILVLGNVTIRFSQTNECGGAVYSDGTLIVSESTFENNTGALAGGAVCTGPVATNRLRIADSTFNGNKTTDAVTGYGGAIFISGPIAEATIFGSTFLNNSARLGGGLTVWTGASAILETQDPARPLTFLGNSATQDGGAIYNAGTLQVHKAGLNANTVPQNTLGIGHGGAIASLGTLTVTDSQITVNQGRFGGGLFVGIVNNAQANISRVTFSQNNAGEFGGGLCIGEALFPTSATVTINDSVFRNNNAGVNGGGLYRHNALLTVLNSSFTDNQAFTVGGGLYIGAGPGSDPASVNITSATFGGNLAGSNQGGGIYNNSGKAILTNLTIKDNSNGLFNAGGAVLTRLRNSVLDNPNFLNCDNGGVPIINDGDNLSTDNSCGVGKNNIPAQLGPRVINNNGINQTRYYPPLPGSPLINGALDCPKRDQRGAARPDTCDIGAVEYGGLAWFIHLPMIRQ